MGSRLVRSGQLSVLWRAIANVREDTLRATYSSDKISSPMATGASRQALPLTVASSFYDNRRNTRIAGRT